MHNICKEYSLWFTGAVFYFGCDNLKNRHIRIFNLSRTEDRLVVTSIHELAHHINFIDDTSHSFELHGQEFYKNTAF